MSARPSRPVTESILIAGPAGQLEAIIDTPAGTSTQGQGVAVVCHPHPVYGGTMTNKVVHMLAKSFNEVGVPAVRFNFRGTGASAGVFDEGDGETDDALAVLDFSAQRWPGAQLWLAGFSFGGAVAIRAAVLRNVRRLITVAPAVRRVGIDTARLPQCPWLLVQGDRDELVDAADIQHWARTLASPPQLVLLPGVDHFFHGRLNNLCNVVVDWLRGTVDG